MGRTGATSAEIVVTTLQRAISANPQSVPARLALIGYLPARQGFRVSTVHGPRGRGSASKTRASRILGALAQAHEAAGDTNQAIETLNRWATLEPRSATPLVRLAAIFAKRQGLSQNLRFATQGAEAGTG